MFCKVLNNRLVHFLDKGVLHERQAGFLVNRSYTLNEIVPRQVEGGYIHMLSFYMYRRCVVLCGGMVCG